MEKVISFDFIGKAKYFIVFSLAVMAFSFFQWFSRGEDKFGIDFKGGHELVVAIDGSNTFDIEKALSDSGFESVVVQAYESGTHQYALRFGGELEEASKVKEKVKTTLDTALSRNVEIVATDFVGPTIGKELQGKAYMAIALGIIGMLCYITYRFEFAFAFGAVVALFHDVVVCIGVYLYAGHTLNMSTLAAALTIVGYSVNDTIVIFDRIREEADKHRDMSLKDLANYGITVTISRTIITNLLTLFSATALLVFGGGAIADLSLFLVVGMVAGCYSTMFIATPAALFWENVRRAREARLSTAAS